MTAIGKNRIEMKSAFNGPRGPSRPFTGRIEIGVIMYPEMYVWWIAGVLLAPLTVHIMQMNDFIAFRIELTSQPFCYLEIRRTSGDQLADSNVDQDLEDARITDSRM